MFFLINTSRAQVIEEKAVLLGLRKKLILGVGLDILAPEMPYEIKTKRKYSHKFLKNKKIYITPHVGSMTEGTQRKISFELIKRGVDIVSHGTENHMFLVDLINKGITGKDAEATLGKSNITVNKNTIPNDPESPFITSGLRIGTPASTTRGFKEKEVELVANWICDILDNMEDETIKNQILDKVKGICSKFPVYVI